MGGYQSLRPTTTNLRRKMVGWSWSWRISKVVLFKNISMAFRRVCDKQPSFTVVDGELVSEAGSNPEKEADKMAEGPDANIDDVVVVEDADEGTT